jgi:competence protein ComEC
VRVLFMGDAEAETERWLLARGEDLHAQVLKVAHHGSRYSSGARFLRAVAPELAVVSCGPGNEYHHPHRATLERLARMGVRVWRTDVDGTLSLASDGRTTTILDPARAREVGATPFAATRALPRSQP